MKYTIIMCLVAFGLTLSPVVKADEMVKSKIVKVQTVETKADGTKTTSTTTDNHSKSEMTCDKDCKDGKKDCDCEECNHDKKNCKNCKKCKMNVQKHLDKDAKMESKKADKSDGENSDKSDE